MRSLLTGITAALGAILSTAGPSPADRQRGGVEYICRLARRNAPGRPRRDRRGDYLDGPAMARGDGPGSAGVDECHGRGAVRGLPVFACIVFRATRTDLERARLYDLASFFIVRDSPAPQYHWPLYFNVAPKYKDPTELSIYPEVTLDLGEPQGGPHYTDEPLPELPPGDPLRNDYPLQVRKYTRAQNFSGAVVVNINPSASVNFTPSVILPGFTQLHLLTVATAGEIRAGGRVQTVPIVASEERSLAGFSAAILLTEPTQTPQFAPASQAPLLAQTAPSQQTLKLRLTGGGPLVSCRAVAPLGPLGNNEWFDLTFDHADGDDKIYRPRSTSPRPPAKSSS